MMTNAAFSATPQFQAACAKVKETYGITVEPAASQASKYRRGYGAAYTAEHGLPLGSKAKLKVRQETLECQQAGGKPGKVDYVTGKGRGPYTDWTPKVPEQTKQQVAKAKAAAAINSGKEFLDDEALALAIHNLKESQE